MTDMLRHVESFRTDYGEEEAKVDTPKNKKSLKVYKYSTLQPIHIKDRKVECNTNIGNNLHSQLS